SRPPHGDPAAGGRAVALRGPGAATTSGGTRALGTGTAEIDDLVVTGKPDERRTVAALDVDGYVVVPLTVGGRVLGAITLVGAPGRQLGESEVSLAQDIARRIALALDAERRRGMTREMLQIFGGELRAPLAALCG